MGIIHAVQSLVVKCEFPIWMQYAVVFYAFSILALFLNFYFQAYIKSHRKQKVIFYIVFYISAIIQAFGEGMTASIFLHAPLFRKIFLL